MLDLERKMLDAVEKAYEAWDEQGGPIPQALVNLMKNAHSAILARLARKYGAELDDPMAALIELEREREALKRMIEMQNRGALQ